MIILDGFSNGLDELYEILPFLLPCLYALPYRLKLWQSCEGILYIFGVFLAHDQKDGIIQLNDAISIDDPRCIRKVFQPFVRQQDFNLLVISVFLIECHHHLSQSIPGHEVKGFFGVAYPPCFLVVMQYPYEIDELYEGLIAHDCNRAVQLLLIDLFLAPAFCLFADVAVIIMRGDLWLVDSLGCGALWHFAFAILGQSCLHFWWFSIDVLVLDVSVQCGIGSIGLAASLRAGKLFDDLLIFAPVYFLHIYYHQIVQINRAIKDKRHHPLTIVYRPFSQEMARQTGMPISCFLPWWCILMISMLLWTMSKRVQISGTEVIIWLTEPPWLLKSFRPEEEMEAYFSSQPLKKLFRTTQPSMHPTNGSLILHVFPILLSLAHIILHIHSACSDANTEIMTSPVPQTVNLIMRVLGTCDSHLTLILLICSMLQFKKVLSVSWAQLICCHLSKVSLWMLAQKRSYLFYQQGLDCWGSQPKASSLLVLGCRYCCFWSSSCYFLSRYSLCFSLSCSTRCWSSLCCSSCFCQNQSFCLCRANCSCSSCCWYSNCSCLCLSIRACQLAMLWSCASFPAQFGVLGVFIC